MVSAYLVAISRIIADVVNTINDHRGHPTDRPRGPSSSHWVMFLNPYFFPLSYSHITFYAILGTGEIFVGLFGSFFLRRHLFITFFLPSLSPFGLKGCHWLSSVTG